MALLPRRFPSPFHAAGPLPGFARWRPRVLELRSGYSRREFAADGLAGLTVGLIALPLSLALGIASLPATVATPHPAPAIGLYTAILGGFLVALLGGSRVQIAGPTAAFVPVVLLIVERHGFAGLTLASLMAGAILLLMGLVRLGSLIKYIPWPVTSGFTSGIAVTLILSQAADFLALSPDQAAPREFFAKLAWLVDQGPSLRWPGALLALGCVGIILTWPRWGWRRLPGSIVAMLVATAASALWLHFGGSGIDTIGSRFGATAIPAGWPSPSLPQIDWSTLRDLIGPATAIALLGAIESLLSAVVADGMTRDRHDANTELMAQGAANLVTPLFGGLPVTGAIARTSANVANGGRSPVAGMVHALTLLAIILLCAPLAVHVPLAAMSAVLIMVALRMGEWHELRALGRMPRSDALVLLTTFGLTVVFDLVIAVEVGVVLAAMLFIHRIAATTEISPVTATDELETPEQVAHGKEIPEGVLVYRIFGPFLFGAAEKMEEALRRIDQVPRVLILRMQLVPAMDATALHALRSVVERLREQGGTVVLSGPHRQPLEMMRRAGFIEFIGRENIRAHFDDALARARELKRTEAAGDP